MRMKDLKEKIITVLGYVLLGLPFLLFGGAVLVILNFHTHQYGLIVYNAASLLAYTILLRYKIFEGW